MVNICLALPLPPSSSPTMEDKPITEWLDITQEICIPIDTESISKGMLRIIVSMATLRFNIYF